MYLRNKYYLKRLQVLLEFVLIYFNILNLFPSSGLNLAGK